MESRWVNDLTHDLGQLTYYSLSHGRCTRRCVGLGWTRGNSNAFFAVYDGHGDVFLPTPSYRRKSTAYVGCFDSNCPISIVFPVIYASRRRLASTMTLQTLEAVNSPEHTIQPQQTYATVPRGFRLFGEVRTRSYLAFSDWPNSPFPVLLVRDFFLCCQSCFLFYTFHFSAWLIGWLIIHEFVTAFCARSRFSTSNVTGRGDSTQHVFVIRQTKMFLNHNNY